MFPESRQTSNDESYGGTSHRFNGIYREERSPIQDRGERGSNSTNQQSIEKDTFNVDGKEIILSVAFLMEGEHILGGGWEGNIGRWQLDDGKGVGMPLDAGGIVNNIAISRNGKWIVGGSGRGRVLMWSALNHERMGEMKGHADAVGVVDISPDGIKIASGSVDKTVCIWFRRTGERLLTLKHDNDLAAVKFSPDGSLLATATWLRESVRIYNSKDGRLAAEFPIQVGSCFNQCLAWNDKTHLYAISLDGRIHYLDVTTGETLSQWPIRTDGAELKRGCIALPRDRAFIAASANSSISFWNTTTHTKIGSSINYDDRVRAMAISENYDIVIGHGKTITVRDLGEVLPCRYVHNNLSPEEKITSARTTQDEQSHEKISNLEKAVQELKNGLAVLQGHYEAQLRELASTTKELGTLKTSNDAKDRKIEALTAEVEKWKRSDAAKGEELAAANKILEKRHHDSQELVIVREELCFSQSQTIDIREWYGKQFNQLKSDVEQSQRIPFLVQNFITLADARAEMNIIETLQRLNESIQWSSIFIADCVIHNFQPRVSNPTEDQLSIAKRVAESIGQSLVNRIRSNSHTDLAVYLPVAFHAYLLYYLCGIMTSWSLESGPNHLIRKMYKAVRKLESQTISGRWRSLTYACISPTCSSNPDMLIMPTMDGLLDIIVVAGCAPSTSAAREMISSKFRDRISFILTTAGQLSKSIMDALSADYRVETVRPAEMLDEGTMEVNSVGGRKSRSQRVLCTTQMGLSKEVITQTKVGSNKRIL
ncbi:WD40-repeat-containing domain protein [Chiua virens]|nr:WD40-repeat-containing domain protein [Chiua virens]